MALNKTVLEQAIKAVFDQQAAKNQTSDDPAISRQEIAKGLANAIEAYVKSGTVNTTITGTATGGAVTGTGTGTIS